MLVQYKAMKLTWSTARGSGAGRVRFQGAKKRPAEGEYMNSLVAHSVKVVFNINKSLNYKVSSDSGSEDKQDHFNLETLKIGEEWQTARTSRSNDAEVPEIGTKEEQELYTISHLINPNKKKK